MKKFIICFLFVFNLAGFAFSQDYSSLKTYLGGNISVVRQKYKDIKYEKDAWWVYTDFGENDRFTMIAFTCENNTVYNIQCYILTKDQTEARNWFSRLKNENRVTPSGVLISDLQNKYLWRYSDITVTHISIETNTSSGSTYFSVLLDYSMSKKYIK